MQCCRQCSVVGSERVPPPSLGWYFSNFYLRGDRNSEWEITILELLDFHAKPWLQLYSKARINNSRECSESLNEQQSIQNHIIRLLFQGLLQDINFFQELTTLISLKKRIMHKKKGGGVLTSSEWAPWYDFLTMATCYKKITLNISINTKPFLSSYPSTFCQLFWWGKPCSQIQLGVCQQPL